MRRRLRPVFWLAATLAAALAPGALLSACAGTKEAGSATDAARSAPAGADDIVVFFRSADIESISDQALAEYPDTDAGDSTKLARDFPDAPPQIPHSVEDMYPITLADNECLACHDPENAVGANDVPLPESHFMAPIMGEGGAGNPMTWVVNDYRVGQEVSGARYNCNMCHTPQATNVATPRNLFDSPRSVK